MQEDEWVVLAEHGPESLLRDGDAGLLYLEAVLKEEGIETLFDPYRPGEWVGPGYGGPPQIRLLVMQHDLERASQILLDLESSEPADLEPEAGSDGEGGPDEADELDVPDDCTTEPLMPLDMDSRFTSSSRPPMDKAINPGCATFLLAAVATVGLLIRH